MSGDNGKVIPVGGAGLGTLEALGMQQVVIDTAQDGFPEGRIDLLLIPAGQVQPACGVSLPKGAIVTIIEPVAAMHIRAAVRAAQRVKKPAPANPAQTG